MVEPVGQTDPLEQVPGPGRRIGVGVPHQRRDEHVLEHGALRQQQVVLKDETDTPVPERRQLGRRQRERVDPV